MSVPPLIVRLPDLEEYGGTMRAKIFDFGVVSIRISVPFAGTLEAFGHVTRRLRRDARVEALARAALDDVLVEIAGALDEPHQALLEDYFVLEVDRSTPPIMFWRGENVRVTFTVMPAATSSSTSAASSGALPHTTWIGPSACAQSTAPAPAPPSSPPSTRQRDTACSSPRRSPATSRGT